MVIFSLLQFEPKIMLNNETAEKVSTHEHLGCGTSLYHFNDLNVKLSNFQ
jgi:hypothetical protein